MKLGDQMSKVLVKMFEAKNVQTEGYRYATYSLSQHVG